MLLKKELLREKVLNKKSSPEKLDELLRTTQTGGWILVFVVAVVLITLLIWGIFGKVSVKVNGLGVFMSKNSMVNITYNQPGEVTDIAVAEGDYVVAGQYLFRVGLPKLELEAYKARTSVAISSDKEHVNQTLLNLATMEMELQKKTIYSPVNGSVVEVNVNEGDVFNTNNVLMRISESNLNKKNPAIIYLSAEEGKKVQKNMKVLISPTTVSADEFGSIIGIVKDVSSYVRSNEALVKEVNSAEMAKKIMDFTRNAPIRVIVDPQLSTKTPSGYVWTTEIGPPFQITEGTVCNGSIIVRKQRPITMVITWLKNLLQVE